MEYQQFVINAFEIRRGKWRARISRQDGRPLAIKGRKLARECVTGSDEKTAGDALLVAMDMVDWGTISMAAGIVPRRNVPAGEVAGTAPES
jgi:hypothetical protein